jgi:hypothetical protein
MKPSLGNRGRFFRDLPQPAPAAPERIAARYGRGEAGESAKGGQGGTLNSALALLNPVTQKQAAELLNIGVDTIKRKPAGYGGEQGSDDAEGEIGRVKISPHQLVN